MKNNLAFKLDPQIKYSIRDSHKLFSLLVKTFKEPADNSKIVDYSSHIIDESTIISKLEKALILLNMHDDVAEKNL